MKTMSSLEVPLPLNTHPGIVRAEKWTTIHRRQTMRKPVWMLHFPHYSMEFTIFGHVHRVYPGCAILTPPDAETISTYPGVQHHCFAHFQYPAAQQDAPTILAPCVLDLEDKYVPYNGMFLEVAHAMTDDRVRAEVVFWHLLYLLYGRQPAAADRDKQLPPIPIRNALNYIQENLASPIAIPQIAEYAGISPAHLTRCFQRYFQMPPAKYILQKRLAEARKQLETTDFLIKEVAASVGIVDRQHFNKLIRKHFGMSPSELRRCAAQRHTP